MKFICSVEINAARSHVVQLFDNVDNLKEWQDGFIRVEHLEGIEGSKGAKSNMVYKFGRGEMVIKETIIENNLPDNMNGLYEHKHMVNTMINSFVKIDEHITLYVAEVEYTKMIGILPKLMAFLFPSMFKKQVQKWLNQFKIFVEDNSIMN